MTLTSLAEYRERLAAMLAPVDALDVRVTDAVGSMVADTVTARATLPARDVAAHDGFAVNADDVASATTATPVTLPVTHDADATTVMAGRLVPGSAVRVTSGAPIPEGATTVIALAHTQGDLAHITVVAPSEHGYGVRERGADLHDGDVIVERGTTMSGRHATALLAAGVSRLAVRPAPRVVVVPVGSDLVRDQRESTSVAVAALVDDAGAQSLRTPPVGDERHALRRTIEDHLVRADVLVTVGGVSRFDTVVSVLESLGDCESFDVDTFPPIRVAHARVQAADSQRTVTIIALPGHPVRAVAGFEVCVRPVLKAMGGALRLERVSVPAVWESDVTVPEAGVVWLPVTTTTHRDGTVSARPAAEDPWSLAALIAADAYALLDEDTPLTKGGAMRCAMWES